MHLNVNQIRSKGPNTSKHKNLGVAKKATLIPLKQSIFLNKHIQIYNGVKSKLKSKKKQNFLHYFYSPIIISSLQKHQRIERCSICLMKRCVAQRRDNYGTHLPHIRGRRKNWMKFPFSFYIIFLSLTGISITDPTYTFSFFLLLSLSSILVLLK